MMVILVFHLYGAGESRPFRSCEVDAEESEVDGNYVEDMKAKVQAEFQGTPDVILHGIYKMDR